MTAPRLSEEEQKALQHGRPLTDKQLEELGVDFSKAVDRKVTLPEAQKAMAAAQKAARAGNWSETVSNLLVAWEASPNDLTILTILAHALVQLGVREKAIAVLERALAYHDATPDICAIMLEMAIRMEYHDIAIKIGHELIRLAPDNPAHIVNVASAYLGANRYDEGIALLQAVLPQFPDNGDLWNVLGTIVRQRDGMDAGDVFFEEALRVDPKNFKALSNYAQTLIWRMDFDRSLEMDRRAMKANPANPEPFIGAAQIMFYKGQMKEAWRHYERRMDSGRSLSQSQIYTNKIPLWRGEKLRDKTLFVMAEQGIGDELMFGSYLPFLYDQAEKLVIGCDPRIISIYQRRFPNAVIGGYKDFIVHGYRYRSFPEIEKLVADGDLAIDLAIPVGSCPRYGWKDTKSILPHPEGFLSADAALAADFARRMEPLRDKPIVGISWRSGNVSGLRSAGYASIDDMEELFALGDKVNFVNLQYGECSEELARVKDLYGVTVHVFEDVDLKKDIEANLAIMANCDLVVAAVSAPAIFAMSIGRPTVFLSPSRPWWAMGGEGHVPFAPNATFYDGPKPDDWKETVSKVTAIARERLGF